MQSLKDAGSKQPQHLKEAVLNNTASKRHSYEAFSSIEITPVLRECSRITGVIFIFPKRKVRRRQDWIPPELTLNTRRKTSQRAGHRGLILR